MSEAWTPPPEVNRERERKKEKEKETKTEIERECERGRKTEIRCLRHGPPAKVRERYRERQEQFPVNDLNSI